MPLPIQPQLDNFDEWEHQANDPIHLPPVKPTQETVILILDGEWLFDFYATISK